MLLAPLVTACAGSIPEPRTAGTYKVGKPYQIAGKWYHPSDDRKYEETGIASWYGPTFHGKATANGERFDENALTAAHRTLPMPSYVEVTNLENGRKLTVRVNDRGPFARDRILDLSRRSAQLLGIEQKGTAKVRVKRVYPEPAAATIIAQGFGEEIFVQVAALSDRLRAAHLAAEVSRYGTSNVSSGENGFYRVRVGPFTDEASAASVLAELRSAGYSDAKIIGRKPRV